MTSTHRVHRSAALPPPRVEELADGVFAYIQPDGSWWLNNTGFVAGTSHVLAVDTCSTERRTRSFVKEIERIAGQVPRTLLNTHHHGDHTNGNYLLPYATILGHERCREEMLKAGITQPDGIFGPVEWGELTPAPPFVTFKDKIDVYLDDLRVELCHIGTAAHTTNDVVAWIPEHRILFTGDLVFNGATPFVLMGSVSGSLLALDRLLEYEAELIVPGHGEVCSADALDLVGEYLRFVQLTAEHAKGSGLTPLEAAREVDLGSQGFGHLLDPERLVGNLHRAYAECDGARPGDPIDLLAAFTDMVAYNGGSPLSCFA
jgi:cyclase